MKVFVGIDPGKDGAMAFLGWGPSEPVIVSFDELVYADRLWHVSPMLRTVAEQELNAMMRVDAIETFAVVEHVNAMPGQGVTSCFSFGKNFGFILGLLTACRIPYQLVRPQVWKKEFGCTSDKNTSIEVAQRLYPNADLYRTARCTKPHDGRAEALLMAEYARRIHGQP